MAMKQAMTLQKAREYAEKIAAAYAKYGSQTSVPFNVATLSEVITVLHGHANFDGPSQEALTLVNRQLAACKAREARRKSKEELEESE